MLILKKVNIMICSDWRLPGVRGGSWGAVEADCEDRPGDLGDDGFVTTTFVKTHQTIHAK